MIWRDWGALLFGLLLALTARAGGLTLDRATLHGATGTRTVTLPHQLDAADLPRRGGEVRYTLRVDLPAPPSTDAPLALLVPKLSLSGALHINGRFIARCAPAPLAQSRCLHQPHLFVPPPDSWRAGDNEITLVVHGDDRQPNGLSAIVLDSAQALGPRQAWLKFWRSDIMVLLGVALTTLGLLFLLGAVFPGVRPRDRRLYGLMGIAGIVNALCGLNFVITVPDVGYEAYSGFTFSIRLVSLPLYGLTMLAFFDRLSRAVRLGALAAMILMPLLVAASGNDRTVVQLLYVPLGLWITALQVAMLHWSWRSGLADQRLVAAVGLLVTLAGWMDFTRILGATPFERVYLLPYAYPTTLLAIGYHLLKGIGAALIQQRRLSTDLERQVAAREAELQRVYRQMLLLEQQRIRDEERDALLAHVHDGMGAQLVTARVALESGRLPPRRAAQILQDCSDDLRLVISTMRHREQHLLRTLADFRHRLQARLAEATPALQWDIALDGLPALDPDQVLQLMRILQEAVSNAIWHAEATRLTIRVRWFPEVQGAGRLDLAVLDDGRGFDARSLDDLSHPHQGLLSMRRRAESLGAHFALDSDPQGTRVLLRWHPRPAGVAPT